MIMDRKGEGVFQEVDVMSLIRVIGNKNKVTQAKILQKLETVISDPDDYAEVRKFILDELNGLTRAFVKATFGNIEFLIK
jgi:hypothetical protein